MLRKKRVTLTEESASAIAAGVPVEQAVADHPDTSAEAPVEDPAAATADPAAAPAGDPPATETPAAQAPAEGDDGSEPPPVAAGSETPAASAESDATLSTMLNKLGEVQTELATRNVELEAVKASLTAAQSLQASFMDIAKARIQHMNVALGGHQASLDHLSAEQLLTQYEATSADFSKRFFAGGKAEVKVDDDRNSDTVVSIAPAVARATSFSNKRG